MDPKTNEKVTESQEKWQADTEKRINDLFEHIKKALKEGRFKGMRSVRGTSVIKPAVEKEGKTRVEISPMLSVTFDFFTGERTVVESESYKELNRKLRKQGVE